MKVALAQVNTTVGDVAGNAARVEAAVARAPHADLVVFPELTLPGYPPLDLLDSPGLLAATEAAERALVGALRSFAGTVVFGSLRPGGARPAANVAVAARAGEVLAVGTKSLLPTYDVFDEDRYFTPGAPASVPVAGRRVALTICEDLWTGPASPERGRHGGPLALGGPDLVVNLSASPFERGKAERRRRVMAEAAKAHGCPVAHVNLVGGNDELIFDGGSLCVRPDGALLAHASAFVEEVSTFELDGRETAPPAHRGDGVLEALTLGLGDYVRKVCARGVVLGLSGGIDSAVTAALAVRALGRDNVVGLALPSEFSSTHSLEDAFSLAEALGIQCHEVSIQGPLDAARICLSGVLGDPPWGLADENLQARIRGQVLMAYSNRHGPLVLSTGNKSELAVGYSTLYGDLCGALLPIGDLWKTEVYALARRLNTEHHGVIPERSLTKAPSAELRPDQADQDSLPPYPALDAVLQALLVERAPLEVVCARGVLPREEVMRVAAMVRSSEYKRRQAPIVLRVSGKAFGAGRRMPVARGGIA